MNSPGPNAPIPIRQPARDPKTGRMVQIDPANLPKELQEQIQAMRDAASIAMTPIACNDPRHTLCTMVLVHNSFGAVGGFFHAGVAGLRAFAGRLMKRAENVEKTGRVDLKEDPNGNLIQDPICEVCGVDVKTGDHDKAKHAAYQDEMAKKSREASANAERHPVVGLSPVRMPDDQPEAAPAAVNAEEVRAELMGAAAEAGADTSDPQLQNAAKDLAEEIAGGAEKVTDSESGKP